MRVNEILKFPENNCDATWKATRLNYLTRI
jgi:hypothetical protein